MPLSAEQIYNHLSGEDCKQILLTRFQDLLNGVPEFARHLTLPRVQMSLIVHLDISGRTPPTLDIKDDLVVRMREVPPLQPGEEEIEQEVDLEAEINADTDKGGQPPDQIREEHGLPISEPRRGAFGYQDQPTVREEGIKYASFVTQDYGPARQRTGQEPPILASDVITKKNTHGGGGGPIQADFREAIKGNRGGGSE